MLKSSQRSRAIAVDAAMADAPFAPLQSVLALVVGSLTLWALALSLCLGVARLL